MKSTSLKGGPDRVDPGGEAFKATTNFANREDITGASITAIGALSAGSTSPPKPTSRLQ
jgi:uncharacterized protein